MNLDLVPLTLSVVLLSVATYRLARLVVFDDVIGEYPTTEHPRGTFIRKWIDLALFTDDNGTPRNQFTNYLGKLITCPYCVGFWIALVLSCLWFRLWPFVFTGSGAALGVDGWIVVFAICGGQAFLQSRGERK